MLVTEHISNITLIGWHSLLLSEVERLTLVLVSVLHIEVFFLRELGEILKRSAISDQVHEFGCNLLASSDFTVSIPDQVKHGSLFVISESSHAAHELSELILVVLMSLIPGLGVEVERTDKLLELWVVDVGILQEVLVKVVLEIELSDLSLRVRFDFLVIGPLGLSHLLEQVQLASLALGRLGVFLSLGESEWKGKKLFSV